MNQRKAVSRMSSDHEGIAVHAIRGRVPVVVAFGRIGTQEDPTEFEHAALFGRILGQGDRRFSRLDVHDPHGAGFYRGVSRLPDSIEGAVAAIRSLIDELAPSEVITFGEGLAGHAALVLGSLLGATRIVAVEPPSHLIADELALYHDRRWGRILAEFPDPVTARLHDVAALFDRIGYSGHASVLFGSRPTNEHDDAVNLNALHAHRLALSGRVALRPFPEVSHGLLHALIRGGDAGRVLSSHLFDDPAPPAAGPGVALEERLRVMKNNKILYHFKFSICNIEESRGHDPASANCAYAAVGVVNPSAHRATDDGWRRWIAENLMNGSSPAVIRATLVENGFPEEEAALEVKDAMESPYFRGARRLRDRYAKRGWIIEVYRKLNRLAHRSMKIDRLERPARGEFVDGYFAANRPVIITGMMDDRQSLGERLHEALARKLAEGPRDEDLLIGEDGWQEKLSIGPDDLPPFPEYLGEQRLGSATIRLSPAGMGSPFLRNPANALVAQMIGRRRVLMAPSWDGPLMGDAERRSSALAPRPPSGAAGLSFNQPQIFECLPDPGEILFLPVGWWSFIEVLEHSATIESTDSWGDQEGGSRDVALSDH